ncbi:hypothetical protein DYB38_012325 [Aphanomyces astaci]|uniref:3-oxo-5-alpha-steroid 4-dehydrogenase C-terminal domain-containing protein n=7 Tax=Aphanomyces astaci TaxID=112090 RepID=A0A397EAT9_APHAT|nr:hypothetical protein DYB38_012325 [Aphanomyces astaci]
MVPCLDRPTAADADLAQPPPPPSSGRLEKANSKTWLPASTRARRRTLSSETDEHFALTVEHVAIFLVGDHTLITVKPSSEDDASIWQAVHRRLASTYSKVRHNDANFLLYSVLDVIVDQMTGVMDDVRSYLMHLEQQLDTLLHRFDIETLRDVHSELGQLPRVIKPTRDVLKSLLASRDLPDTTKAYLRDVHDHLNHILDEIEWQFQMCKSMTEEYRDAKATQTNYVVYVLTIVTTVFLPAQFLTGVYGMNFGISTMVGDWVAYLWMVVAAATFCLLHFVTAPFGRHTSSAWGPTLNNRLGWFVMEVPSLVIMARAWWLFVSDRESNFVWLPFALWTAHYWNRAVVFPLRIKSTPKRMPVVVVAAAIGFNLVNATLNATYLLSTEAMYSSAWLHHPRTLTGLALFLIGMSINVTTDNHLISLRSNGSTGYSIPRGFLFEYVTCANLLGECIEWTGFAIATWNLAGLSFMIWTWANLVPRAASHHAWCVNEFKDYPKNRRRIIPFVY